MVLGTQSALLGQQSAATDLQARQLDVRVQLVRALGGGWSADAQTAQNTAKR